MAGKLWPQQLRLINPLLRPPLQSCDGPARVSSAAGAQRCVTPCCGEGARGCSACWGWCLQHGESECRLRAGVVCQAALGLRLGCLWVLGLVPEAGGEKD